jgi:diguanylate cyclase (GGDEF)-like protein
VRVSIGPAPADPAPDVKLRARGAETLGVPHARAEHVDSRIRAVALAWLYFAGATIGALSLILPHPPESSIAGLWSNVGLAYFGWLVILVAGPRAPAWFFHASLAIGSAVITRAVLLSGDSVSFYAVWYIWVGLYAFYFFERLPAMLHVGFAAALYGGTLAIDPPTSAVARWLTTVTTLIVAGGFIDTLVRRSRRHADEAREDATSMATVAAVAHELAALSESDAAREALCAAAARVTGAASVALWEPMSDGAGLQAVTGAPRSGARPVLTFVGPRAGAAQAFATGRTITAAGDAESQQLAPELSNGPLARVCLWQPVLRDKAVVAVLGFYWDSPDALSRPAVRTLIELLAAECTTTMVRVELVDRLASAARTDDLTGLPNRRAWDEQLEREISRADREHTPLCVAILDLDLFKDYNDQHGHQAGDRLLKQAAAAWSGELRATDVLARYGGEEFAIALPNLPQDEARMVLERLRAATPGNQSCSAGGAFWARGESGAELFGRADAALYDAKRTGRDQALFA